MHQAILYSYISQYHINEPTNQAMKKSVTDHQRIWVTKTCQRGKHTIPSSYIIPQTKMTKRQTFLAICNPQRRLTILPDTGNRAGQPEEAVTGMVLDSTGEAVLNSTIEMDLTQDASTVTKESETGAKRDDRNEVMARKIDVIVKPCSTDGASCADDLALYYELEGGSLHTI
jgi:hypothetical protein